jgi:hypothetical protein
VEKFEI